MPLKSRDGQAAPLYCNLHCILIAGESRVIQMGCRNIFLPGSREEIFLAGNQVSFFSWCSLLPRSSVCSQLWHARSGDISSAVGCWYTQGTSSFTENTNSQSKKLQRTIATSTRLKIKKYSPISISLSSVVIQPEISLKRMPTTKISKIRSPILGT